MENSFDHVELGQRAARTKTAPVQSNSPAQPQTTKTVKCTLGLLIPLVLVALAVAAAAMVIHSEEMYERERHKDQTRELQQQIQDQIRERNLQKDQLRELKQQIQEQGKKIPNGGAMYVQWGSQSCSSYSELVYAGVAGGTRYNSQGGASNYVCLTREPVWANYKDGYQGGGRMYGAEYQHYYDVLRKNIQNEDVPCAVCRSSTYTSMVMIPGTRWCTSGWKKAYSGYLMSGTTTITTHYRTEYVCVDGDPDVIVGGGASKDGALFYPVEAACGSLPCPPYVAGRELTCVVCLK